MGIASTASSIYHEPNFLSFRTPLPTVVTIHDLSILRYPETHPRDRVAFMTRRLGESIRRADCVISDSEYGRQEILAEYNLPSEKVVSVLLAAGSVFSPVAADRLPGLLAPFGLQPGQYILSVGTLEPRKNLTTAIKAYARLPEAIRQDMPFVIAGMKGWRTDGLDKEVAALIEKGQIRRLGYVPDEALPALYSGTRAFVYPSLYEGFGLPPLEAMACGAPVIISNRSSLPEVVGDAGLQVDALDVDGLAQAMSQIIEDDVLRASLRQRGMERAKGFSWRRCAEETLAVYRKVVTG
jgi:alpha-1,3-rhamnosyl/mannosyltransferase